MLSYIYIYLSGWLLINIFVTPANVENPILFNYAKIEQNVFSWSAVDGVGSFDIAGVHNILL